MNKLDKNLLRIRSLILIVITFLIFFVALYLTVIYIRFDRNDMHFVTLSSKIYDKNGIFLWELAKDNAVKNTPISLNNVPQNCINAIVAIEDKTFWQNIGVDPNGLVRLVISIFTDGSAGGGSTISQQVIKNESQQIYNRDPVDKINEIVRAVKLNNLYSKDEILEMYLNNIFFGNLNYGIESASLDFFNKSASDLDLAECSYLMGVPQWPGVYNPYGNIEKGKERQYLVLSAMLDQGYITSDDFDNAYSQSLDFQLEPTEVRAPHFLQFVNDNIVDKYSIDANTIYNNLNINTTYDYSLHRSILEDLNPYIKSLNSKNINNSAVVILDTDHNIEVMIGSIDFFDDGIEGKFNSALGQRQPGTSLIPLIYKYAVLSDFDMNKQYPNTPIEIPVQRDDGIELLTVSNFINNYQGNSNLSDALNESYPVTYANFVQDIGLPDIESYLSDYRLYDSKPNICQLSLVVEGCEISLFEMTLAYSNLSNSTLNNKFNFINSIDNQLMSVNIVNQNDIDLFPVNYNSEWFVYNGDTINNKDIFAFAKSKEYTVGVWVGNTKGSELVNVSSVDIMPTIIEMVTSKLN